ncbi:uncharacterized protein DEA37_0012018 [Paragonimus westermani]|uniref:Uncharacterized protein n=1 Tax=Paragonimus westermani TaxID=34504 RepID=A0A5J4NMJ6_9TREM|nr:uncharacterized protein DEA37_0012018 [Paragonimus westermani]
MRVLYENIPAFADKLCLPEVYAAFELLLANAKKFTKPDGMARLEEFEAKVHEFHQKGVADEAAVRRAELAAKALKTRARHGRACTSVSAGGGESVRRNLRRATRSVQSVNRSDEDEMDGDGDSTEETGASVNLDQPTPLATRGKRMQQGRAFSSSRRNRRERIVFDSDEDDGPPASDYEE